VTALQEAEGGAEAFARKAAEKARGNLGYLGALARGIDQALARKDSKALQALLSLKELPTDLGGLYAFFLHQIKASVARERIELKDVETGQTYDKPVWPSVYDPILGVLAVAMEPLDLDQLVRLGGVRVERAWVSNAIDRLLQFLDVLDGRYRLYHATVAEFLLAKETHENPDTSDLYQVEKHWQECIVSSYGAKAASWATVDWSTVDTYGLRHLAGHLYALSSDPNYRNLLYEFVNRPVILAKWQRFGSLDSLTTDLKVAMNAAAQESPLNWVEFMRCYLQRLPVDLNQDGFRRAG
jgi:hypothetical protein